METQTANRRSQAKHQNILRAAIECVEEAGYAATSIEAVAKCAGVGKQTIYRWWPNKASLYVEVYRHLLEPNEAQKASSATAPGTSLEQVLVAVMRALREGVAGQVLKGLISEATSDEKAKQALQEGLVLGRADVLLSRLPQTEHAQGAQELIIAMIWYRLVMTPDTLDDAFAIELARRATAHAQGGPQ